MVTLNNKIINKPNIRKDDTSRPTYMKNMRIIQKEKR